MRMTRAVLVCMLLIVTAGCGDTARGDSGGVDGGPNSKPAADATTYPANVVHLSGVGSVHFGDRRTDLIAGNLVKAGAPGCDGKPVYDVPGYADAADLVFNAQDQLAFVWVLTPGVHTPENVTVDSPISAVRKAYPGAEELKANDHSFPGLLVKGEKTAYLFLYEPGTGQVIKLLAGYTDILREGQSVGITC